MLMPYPIKFKVHTEVHHVLPHTVEPPIKDPPRQGQPPNKGRNSASLLVHYNL